MQSFNRVIDQLRQANRKIITRGTGQAIAQCPAHEDNKPSLAIAHKDNKTLLQCFAGCTVDDVCAAIGFTSRDLFDQPLQTATVTDLKLYKFDPNIPPLSAELYTVMRNSEPQLFEAAIDPHERLEWVYMDADWEPHIKVTKTRFPDGSKTFRQAHWNGYQWVNGLGQTEPILYELPAVLATAADGGIIVICEGEKDADTFNAACRDGRLATTAPMGAGKWRDTYTEALQGAARIDIIHDNDEPGIKHATKIIEHLDTAGIPWRILTPAKGKDLTDHINAGLTLDDLIDDQQRINDAKQAAADKALARAIQEERIKQTARDTIRKEQAEKAAAERYALPTYRHTLTEELNITDEPMPWLIKDLWPANANTTLTATFKAGKTTSIITVIKSLADQQPLFNNPQWTPADAGRIAFWNYEVSPNQIREWIKERNIINTDQITLFNMRGTRWPLITDYAINHTIQWLQDNQISTWIIDPLARAFVGCGDENSNQDMGIFLDALDYIKDQAGVANLLIAAHTGRNAEQGNNRARGASRFDDWADVRWMLNKDEDDMRFFAADGRDVLVAKGALKYDNETREQTYDPDTRQLNRNQKKSEDTKRELQDKIAAALRQAGRDGMTRPKLATACGLTQQQAQKLNAKVPFVKALETSNIAIERDGKWFHIECVNDATNLLK